MPGSRRRVCILTPTHLGSTPRVVKEATALSHAGFDVSVICVRTLDQIESRDQAVLRAAVSSCERVDLRSRWRRLPARLAQKAARHGQNATGWPIFSDHALSPLTQSLQSRAMKMPADFYIAHYPPALPAAAAAAARHGARFAFDAEDFHLGDWPDEPVYEADRRALRAIEDRYLPRCAYVTAAAPGVADAYAQAYSIARPKVVLNTFPLEQAPPAPSDRGSVQPGPSVYWFSQAIGPHRGLECAVRAISQAQARPHLYVRGDPVHGFDVYLRALAKEVGCEDRLHFLPTDIPSMMEKLAAQYDLGLAGDTGWTRSRNIALTNKLFTYLLAGLPIAMSEIDAHRTFATDISEPRWLYPVDDAGALARRMDEFLGDPAVLKAARARAFALGRTRYNWEFDSRMLVDVVARALSADTGSRSRPRDE